MKYWWYILAILLLVVFVFVKNRRQETDEAAETANLAAPVPETSAAAVIPVMPAAAGVSPATVAAITAAISLVTGRKASEFVCTAIRPQGQAQGFSAWAILGTSEIISTRQRYFERKGN